MGVSAETECSAYESVRNAARGQAPRQGAGDPARTPCIGSLAALVCELWHRERQYSSRDFGTAGTYRRPRIAHPR